MLRRGRFRFILHQARGFWSGWREDGAEQVVEGVKEVEMTNLPLGVVEVPAMTVRCSLAGWEETDSWTKGAKIKD
jgi:hypothetical protein